MIKLTDEKVIYLHSILSAETGGASGLRDMGLLNSALESAFQTFDGAELYPTTEEKAARIGHSIISNHPFEDGNKRTGMLIMLTFLEINGIRLQLHDGEIARVGLAAASGEIGYDGLLEWISNSKY